MVEQYRDLMTTVKEELTNNTFLVVLLSTIVFGVLRWNKKNKKQGLQAHANSHSQPPKVAALIIYPIKSCGPMPVRRSAYTDMGLVYDRFAQISDATTGRYLTPRDPQNAKLLHIVPTIVYEQQQQNSNDKHRSLDFNIHLDLRTKKNPCE